MATNPHVPFPPGPGPQGGGSAPRPPGSGSPPPTGPSPGDPPTVGLPSAGRPPGGPPPGRPPRNGVLIVTLIVAAVALVLSLAGVVLSALALGRSDQAETMANRALNQPVQTTEPTVTDAPPPTEPAPDPTTDPADDPEPTSTPGDISPTAEFKVKYQDQKLRVQSPGCGSGYRTEVDLDEPRVLKEGDGDLSYRDCLPGALDTGLQLAEVPGPNATPADCLENIRTAPGTTPVAPSEGLTLCFLTSQNDAAAQGISQKLVFVTIDSITKDNDHGVLNMTLKAWDVPE